MPKDDQEEKKLLTSLMKQISGDEEGKPSSFPVTMVLLGFVVLVVSLMGIKLALAKRKAAQLAVQVRRAEEEKARIKEQAELGANEEERKKVDEVVRVLSKEVLGLKAKIALRHRDHREYVRELDGITQWDDIVVVDNRDG